MKRCIVCNEEKALKDFRKVKNKYYRNTCKNCERQLNKISYNETLKYIKSLKDKCKICGYDRSKAALDFHHIDPNDKQFTIASVGSRKWTPNIKKAIDEERQKCIIVCKNCHAEIHEGIIKLDT